MNSFMTILVAALFTLTGTASFADNSNKCDWQEKMKTEKIAFLTSAMDLTPAEAEKFWPVYNDMENERRASFKKNMGAFKALDEGLKAGLPEKEISVLVNNYVNAIKASRGVEAKYTPSFLKILSAEKVGKMFVAEEEFRRQQIGRWNDGRKPVQPKR